MATEPENTITSDHPELENLSPEEFEVGRQEALARAQGGQQQSRTAAQPTGGKPAPAAPAPGEQAPTAEGQPQRDPLKELEALKTEMKQRLNRLDAYQHQVDQLKAQLQRQAQPRAPKPEVSPEDAAVMEAQEKYISQLMADRYGLTPEVTQALVQDASQRSAEREVSQFSNAVQQLAGNRFKELEKYTVKLVDEHWDKAVAGDPQSRMILSNPGNLLWFAQMEYAKDANAQAENVRETRTKAVERPTLKPGASPVNGRTDEISEDDLANLTPADLPRLQKQIDKMERANGRR